MHTHVLFILSLVFLWFNTTTATSSGHQLVAAPGGGAVHKCIDKERQALLDFKTKLQDPKDRLSTWRTDEEDNCCEWWGVTCNNQTGHVTELGLSAYIHYDDGSIMAGSDQLIGGSIPPSVGCLGQLETLSLYNNNFSGGLPVSLKNCTQLSILDLGDNSLYGDIPVWIGKKLSRLYALSLNSNNFFGTIPSQICQLVSLQILDLSDNKLYGTIPSCLNSLTSMVQKGSFFEQNVHHYHGYFILRDINGTVSYSPTSDSVDNSYIDHLLIEWQGKVNEFRSILGLLKVIDLSSNNLTGQIPNEVTNLHGLLVLDLSDNSLDGEIPRDIGQMTQLLTLNLSRNMLSREIPPTMSDMTLLNNLDLSFNDLSGRIPSGTQLQTFDASTYIGNAGLCGRPLPKKCSGDEDLGAPPFGESGGDAESTNEVRRWFYIGGATGFATSFWIASSALLFSRRLRHAFFHFHNCLKDWVYVKVAIFIAKLQRVGRA